MICSKHFHVFHTLGTVNLLKGIYMLFYNCFSNYKTRKWPCKFLFTSHLHNLLKHGNFMEILFYKTLTHKLQFTNPVNPNLYWNYMFRKFSTFSVKSPGCLVWARGYLHETGTNSDRHEFVSASIHFFSCVYMRPVWKRTQTGLTSSRSLDRDELLSYRSEFVPFSCKRKRISDRARV